MDPDTQSLAPSYHTVDPSDETQANSSSTYAPQRTPAAPPPYQPSQKSAGTVIDPRTGRPWPPKQPEPDLSRGYIVNPVTGRSVPASAMQTQPSSSVPAQAAGQVVNPVTGRSVPAAGAPSVPSHPASKPPALLFHLYPETGWTKRRNVTFMADDKRTPVYFVDYRSNMADLVVHRGGNSVAPKIGQVEFHHWSDTELVFPDSRTTLEKEGAFSRAHAVNLPACPAPSKRCVWKHTSGSDGSAWIGGHLKLVDASGKLTYAVFSRTGGSSKDGRLGILVPELPQAFVEQIVTSCMAMVEKERRARKRRSAAGGAGGGGGGA